MGVFSTIALAKAGKFKGGTDSIFNVKNAGVGYGKVSAKAPRRAALIARLNAISKQIANGTIKVPSK